MTQTTLTMLALCSLLCSTLSCDISQCIEPSGAQLECTSATRYTACLGAAGCSDKFVVQKWSSITTAVCALVPRTKRALNSPEMTTEEGNLIFAVAPENHCICRVGSNETKIDEIASIASADCAQQVSASAATLSADLESSLAGLNSSLNDLSTSVVTQLDEVVATVKTDLEPKIAATEAKLTANSDDDASLKLIVTSLQTSMAAAIAGLTARQEASDACTVQGQAYDSATKKCVAATWQVSVGTDLKCTTDTIGAFQYDGGLLAVCDGKKFVKVFDIPRGANKDDAGVSCYTLKQAWPGMKDGKYWVNPDGLKAMEVTCKDGWTLLMRIKVRGFRHVRSNDAFNLPVRMDCGECRLSSEDISRFNKAEGAQLYHIDPDRAGYMSWYQYAGKDTDEWPTNLDCNNRNNLYNAGGGKWRWILTSWGVEKNARTGQNGDTGNYQGANHYYPTPYGPEQIFFGTYAGGLRINTGWHGSRYIEGEAGALWVTDI